MSLSSPQRTEISDLGEFGLIRHLASSVTLHHPETILGIGDDAAVLQPGTGMQVLVSTDLLVEGVHFDLSYCPLRHLGYKAAVVNFSDIAAMNGIPKQITVGIALSNRFPLEAVEELYEGINLACKHYKVDLVGGDTCSSNKGLLIAITVLGEAEEKEITKRNTAGEGDLICVTGDLGAAYLGLLVLEREKQVFKADPGMQPDLEGYDYLLERQLKPEARTQYRKLFREAGVQPTAMIDISDGLASEVLHLCHDSNLGCKLYEDKIPVDMQTEQVAEEFEMSPVTAALNGGEDYELLFTIPKADYEKIKSMPDVAVIGYMTDKSEGCYLMGSGGTAIPITAQGWDAFLHSQDKR